MHAVTSIPPASSVFFFYHIRVQDQNSEQLACQNANKAERGWWEDKRQNFNISLSRVTMLRIDGVALTNSE